MSFTTNLYHPIMSHMLLFFLLVLPHTISAAGGSWELLQKSVGISAMHMQLLRNDRVILFDRTDFGASKLPLPPGQCRNNPRDQSLKVDCTAHSAEYNTLTNSIRPLNIFTDTWCSSGNVLSDGRLAQTGGFNDGDLVVRTFQPADCPNCDWQEMPNGLLQSRWYASDHILPDGRIIIIGGRGAFNYEFFPKTPTTSTLVPLPFLSETNDPIVENNLYPFVCLHGDGNLFIFANNRAILFDYNKNVVVRTYPAIPGGDPRSYPSTGSAVLLPVKNLELGANVEAEVLVCGGAPAGSYQRALRNKDFKRALNTCARMKFTDPNPTWVLENMPMARTMSDMVILPNGDVIIINGAGAGSAGWELGRNPVLSPVIYHPDNIRETRFEVMNSTTIPRMYHSCALLLRDGRVLVGGSNPHQFYEFNNNVLFPTELSLEAFLPPYLDASQAGLRPNVITPVANARIKFGKILKIKFSIAGLINPASIKVTMYRPPFNTHSNSMGQRLLVLTNTMAVKRDGRSRYQVKVRTPGSANIAPPGFYMLFVVHQNVPSQGVWVKLA